MISTTDAKAEGGIIDDATCTVSFRTRTSELGFIKEVARRFEVKQSDVLRFAVRIGLQRLDVLRTRDVYGDSLNPLLADVGVDLVDHFDLDLPTLERMINGVPPVDNAITGNTLERLVALARAPLNSSLQRPSAAELFPPTGAQRE
ncbi:MAG: hypothetical protein H6978_09420 [Gammaproteobacteria bacterium]|nr:hypothetical protein [Gammaproteobacteria bacterium]